MLTFFVGRLERPFVLQVFLRAVPLHLLRQASLKELIVTDSIGFIFQVYERLFEYHACIAQTYFSQLRAARERCLSRNACHEPYGMALWYVQTPMLDPEACPEGQCPQHLWAFNVLWAASGCQTNCKDNYLTSSWCVSLFAMQSECNSRQSAV